MNRVAAITNALGDATVYEYDHRGNKTYEGGATYPVRYTYDVYSNKTTMTTCRDEGGTRTPHSGPFGLLRRGIPVASGGDTTTWLYDEASGANTNETVIGVAGTNVLERFTDAYGRDSGYAINGVRQTILGYDEQTGRLATMQVDSTGNGRAGVPPRAADGGGTPSLPEDAVSCPFSWTYLPGSDLKSQLAYPNGLTATWTYDANNQLLQVKNGYQSDGIGRDGSPLPSVRVSSQYDYAYDTAERRIACARSGDAMSMVTVLTGGSSRDF